METPSQALTKRIYTQLAPRMFEKLTPPEIMALSAAIVDECARTGVDALLVLAVIEAESNYDVEAVSATGARGLMQLMPGTFRAVSTAARMMDPIENVRAGIRYIALLHSQGFKRLPQLLLAYNAGPGGAVAIARGEIDATPESAGYAPKVTSIYHRVLASNGVPTRDAGKRFVVASR